MCTLATTHLYKLNVVSVFTPMLHCYKCLTITDIDECTAEGYTCGDNDTATCTNIVGGGFTCECRPGFEKTYHSETVILCTGMYNHL